MSKIRYLYLQFGFKFTTAHVWIPTLYYSYTLYYFIFTKFNLNSMRYSQVTFSCKMDLDLRMYQNSCERMIADQLKSLSYLFVRLYAIFLALVLVVTRVRSSTLPHLFPDLTPISLFGTILHAPLSTSFTAFLALNVANFTSVKRADVYMYLTNLLNTFVLYGTMMLTSTPFPTNVCAISPISGSNDSRKRHEKRLIFKIGTIHPHGLNE